jgi:hypothetical protein
LSCVPLVIRFVSLCGRGDNNVNDVDDADDFMVVSLLVDKEVKDDEEDENDKEFVEFVSREANENDPISRISIGQSEPGTTLATSPNDRASCAFIL